MIFRHLTFVVAEFALAWQLLTVVPLPLTPKDFQRPAGRTVAYFPLVGLVLGLLLAGADWLLYFFLPLHLASSLTLTLWAALTGLLHLDGFMDACDGLLPPREAARRLEIMKDSRVGAFGVVGAILLLLLKFNGLMALAPPHRWLALATVPLLARWSMVWAMSRYPPARNDGLAVFFRQGLGYPQLLVATLTAGLVSIGVWLWYGLGLLVAAWGVTVIVARFAQARLGGLTGDIYGAICELVELVLLLALAAIPLR